MTVFQLTAVFLSLVAAVGWVNSKFLRLPNSVAMLSAGVVAAVVLFAAQSLDPALDGFGVVRTMVSRLNFRETVLGYMLAFLLFGGGMGVDLRELQKRRAAIWTLATLGTLVSTVLVAAGVWAAGRALGVPITPGWALVFGALISPTDPVAVLAAVRGGGVSRRLGAVMQGEALFNDGVGVVVFGAALTLLRSGAAPAPLELATTTLIEAGGGLLIGIGGGHLVVALMRAIDDYVVEATASIALALGAYALAQSLHLSGAIAAAAAGLVVGGYGVPTAMSDEAQRYVQGFWHLVDEVLNALLFLLLGLQVFVVRFDFREAGLWATAIALVVAARFLVVLPWGAYFQLRHEERGASLTLAWGGLRGAISLALALATPHGAARNLVLSMTFAVVVFSVLVQGLTFDPLGRWLTRLSAEAVRRRRWER